MASSPESPVLRLSLTHNGTPHPTPLLLSPSSPLSTLHSILLSHLSLPATTSLRVLASGKTLSPSPQPISSTTLIRSPNLYIISTSGESVSEIQALKPDPLLRGFEPSRPKYVAKPGKSRPIADSDEYGFARVEALSEFADWKKAEAILEELRTDPTVVDVMIRKRWKVGALKEMPPDGKIGEDPVCVLGYNINKGQEIHLRLRTDDRKGFRNRKRIRQVLAHELAHNEISEHNNDFKELTSWIEKAIEGKNWKRTGGKALVEGWKTGPVGGEMSNETSDAWGNMRFVQRLGTHSSPDEGQLQEDAKLERKRGIDPANEKNGPPEHETVETTRLDVVMTSGISEQVIDEKTASLRRGKENNEKGMENVGGDMDNGHSRKEEEDKSVASVRHGIGNAGTGTGAVRNRKVAGLMELGFGEGLCGLALRENAEDCEKAGNWLLTGEHEQAVKNGDLGEIGGKIKEVLERLKGRKRAVAVEALEGLHVYLGNLVRGFGQGKYDRIRATNAAFRRKVGLVEEAVQILQLTGWKLQAGWWQFQGRLEEVWIAKDIVQDMLVQLLTEE